MIIKTNTGNIDISNSRGAIIVGKNSCGKSKILKRIFDSAKKDIIKIDDGTGDEDFKVVYWSVENSLSDSLSGKTSAVAKNQKMVGDNATTTILAHPSSLALTTAIVNFSTELNVVLRTQRKTNIANTGIDVEYSSKPKANNETFEIDLKITLGGKTYDLTTASTGVKTIVTLLLNEMTDLTSTNKKIFLLDELDAFMHPQWVDLLCELVKSLYSNNNFKVIVVTHNPIVISKLAKKHLKLISTIEWGASENDGKVKTLNWSSIILNVKNELNAKPTITTPGAARLALSTPYVESYISSFLTTNICRVFFDDNLVFVEGMSEEIYFGFTHPHLNVVQVGGYHQFPLVFEIAREMGSVNTRFIMDHDKDRTSAATKPYNAHVYNIVSSTPAISRCFRFNDDFDKFISNITINGSGKKIVNALNVVSASVIPVDPHGESASLTTFLS